MKIVILGTAHPYRGGLAAMNERLARELTGRGDEVVIYNFTLQYPGFYFPANRNIPMKLLLRVCGLSGK